MLGTVLGTGSTLVNRQADVVTVLVELSIWWEK